MFLVTILALYCTTILVIQTHGYAPSALYTRGLAKAQRNRPKGFISMSMYPMQYQPGAVPPTPPPTPHSPAAVNPAEDFQFLKTFEDRVNRLAAEESDCMMSFWSQPLNCFQIVPTLSTSRVSITTTCLRWVVCELLCAVCRVLCSVYCELLCVWIYVVLYESAPPPRVSGSCMRATV